jgi:hypothetical protein
MIVDFKNNPLSTLGMRPEIAKLADPECGCVWLPQESAGNRPGIGLVKH